MKQVTLLLLPAVALTAGAGWYAWRSQKQPPAPAPVIHTPRSGPPPTRTVTDPVALFKRAFWREPLAGDAIPNAERQEWSDAEGVTKWAWFLEVNASPDLLKYLREDNSFGLAPASLGPLPDGRPSWFVFDPAEVSVLQSRRGKLQLIFSKEGNKLFATDSGTGFQRGAAAPVSAGSAATGPAPVSGRLPSTSPPHPSP